LDSAPIFLRHGLNYFVSGGVRRVFDLLKSRAAYVIEPQHLWNSIANLARTQNGELLKTLQEGFKYIETESFQSAFLGLFSEINLYSEKLGKTQADKNKKLCSIIAEIARGLAELGKDYPDFPIDVLLKTGASTPLQAWYQDNPDDVPEFEKQMRRKVHFDGFC
jgi:hypothetical protein